MKNLFVFALLVLSILTIYSCSDKTEDFEVDYGYEYFPISIGKTAVYQVDSVIYSKFNDTVYRETSQIREEIVKKDTDLQGRDRYHIHLSERTNFNQSWTSVSPKTWYAVMNESSVERVEENLRFVKMLFPVNTSTTWLGNDQIETSNEDFEFYEGWEYEYQNIGEPFTIPNGETFENTITVFHYDSDLEFNPPDISKKIYSIEVYAKDVGLVYAQLMNLAQISSTLTELEGDPWPGRANSGYMVTKTLLEY